SALPLRPAGAGVPAGGPVAFAADGRLLAVAGADRSIRVWDPAGGKLRALLTPRPEEPATQPSNPRAVIVSLALSADGRLLATATGDPNNPAEPGEITLWDVMTAQPRVALKVPGGLVSAVALSGDGTMLAAGGDDGTLRLYDVATGAERWTQ